MALELTKGRVQPRPGRRPMGLAGVAAAALVAGLLPGPDGLDRAAEQADTSAGVAALDWAWRFASTITSDENDRTRAQYVVAQDLVSIGALEAAVARAQQVEGWRRGLACADFAVEAARHGREAEAVRLIAIAEDVQRGVGKAEANRIGMQLGAAYATLGRMIEAEQQVEVPVKADSMRFGPQGMAVSAAGLAAAGDFPAAMKRMEALGSEADLEFAWRRTEGYLTLARLESLSVAQRKEALAQARASAEKIPGSARLDALTLIAEEQVRLGDREAAGRVLREASTWLAAQGDEGEVAPLQSYLAQAAARCGQNEIAKTFADRALKNVPNLLEIDQPGIYGGVAAAYARLGDHSRAEATLGKALSAAESLVNPRPRALSVVGICRGMGRNGVPLGEATAARLESLLEGLKGPS